MAIADAEVDAMWAAIDATELDGKPLIDAVNALSDRVFRANPSPVQNVRILAMTLASAATGSTGAAELARLMGAAT